ncbi:MAG: protein kinase, partial [Bryobacteraceae bacterium]|nr:protein kinase [Bryobacteraceae bacterium]
MPQNIQDDDVVMSLVEVALTYPPHERETCLMAACNGNTQLMTQVMDCVAWEERMRGFLLNPVLAPQPDKRPFAPGELLDNRFRILREVAEGGMGVVYEAADDKLQRLIALKVAKSGYRSRLSPEVRNATAISHPNVCRIFEIHTTTTKSGEIDFVTMEFLDGETLSAKLARGPIPEPEARNIALQLCAGLAEAHRNGVIHGDLKPNNVILTTQPGGSVRAVITDFGLARRPEAVVGAPLQNSQQGGTPGYMAPELLEQHQKVTVASDIYAMGVLLSKLGCRRVPKDGGENAVVYPRWQPIIQRCLELEPERRFHKVEQIAEAVSPRKRQWLLATAVSGILAIASGAVTYRTATWPEQTVHLALLPFEADQQTAPLAGVMYTGAADRLARIRGNAKTDIRFVAARAATTEKARSSLGATHVLRGTVRQEGERVVVHAYLTDARSQVNVKDWKSAYAPSEMRYVPTALAGMVTGALRLPAVPATILPGAIADYREGLHLLRRNSGVDAALPLLSRAVAIDPDSALTHAALAEGQWWKYRNTGDRVWLHRTVQSVREAERRNPDQAEVHRIAGLLQYDAGRYEQAVSHYLRSIEVDPKSGDAYRRLAMAHNANSQEAPALTAFRQAVAIEPDNYRNQQAIGEFYRERADYGEALKYFEKAVQLVPGEPRV